MSAIARILTVLTLLAVLPGWGMAQSVVPPDTARPSVAATEDSGRQTLEDILARQRGTGEEREPRAFPESVAPGETVPGVPGQLLPQGPLSDAGYWEAVRFGAEGDAGMRNTSVSSGGPAASVLVQDGGMSWLTFREGPLRTYGGYLLVGTVALLTLFYLLAGRIKVHSGFSGIKLLRFTFIERFAHWLLAGSFILLAITGLLVLYVRLFVGGRDTGSEASIMERQADGAVVESIMIASKWVHNNVSWAFMLALVMVFVFWVVHNLPSRTDLAWIAKGGGMFTKGHVPAKKFNAGQKMIFWAVILLGASISASGLSLLFPMELPLFAKSFGFVNDLGLPGLVGWDALPQEMTPQEEMQYAQLWHAIVSFVLMAIIIAHIYLGTVGMEGAFEAMGSGEVDLNWAQEHHSIWAEEKMAERDDIPASARHTQAHPAE